MKIIYGFEKAKKVLDRSALKTRKYPQESAVKKIISDVQKRGDAALFELTAKLDGASLISLEVDKKQVQAAYKNVDTKLVDAMRLAAGRIRAYHEAQQKQVLKSYTHGKTGWKVRPLEKVGVYAPGGTASYPSTVLMTAIPARVAGVKEIVLASPPDKTGSISPAVLVASDIAGVDRVFNIGGAQAIAAMAYGTESVPQVDKICGPGNIYVFLAKKLVYGVVGIDALQGPSEVVVVADATANPEYCAADLLAQAEHGIGSPAILITPSKDLVKKVVDAIARQIGLLSRREIIEQALEKNGLVAVVSDMDEAVELTNLYSPEHVLLLVKPNTAYDESITSAGCIIYGNRATVAMSDYVSGPSHSLPTEGTGRFSSPLNVTDFMKITSLSSVGNALMELAGEAAITIARAEGLDAHARAVEIRLKDIRRNRKSFP